MSTTMEYRYEFLFLNALRESGEVNMFGATPYIQEEFDVTRKEAEGILIRWMAWVSENPENANIF